MSLSRIQAIINLTSSSVTFTDQEAKGPSPISLAGLSAADYSNTPVPWYNAKKFDGHNITITTESATYYVWQYESSIYYSTYPLSVENPVSESTYIGAAGDPLVLYITAGGTPYTMPWLN